MRRMIRTLALVAIATAIGFSNRTGVLQAKDAVDVEYTWTLAALGQGGWIGGPLFEDGTAGGGGAFSMGDGAVIALFRPTTWSEDAAGQITVCFDVILKKGSGLPPSLCIGPAEVTGTPILIDILGGPHIFRITESRSPAR